MAGGTQIRKLVKRDRAICHYCKRMTDNLSNGREPTRDHIVPKAFGGANSMDNYVLACKSCNNRRGTMLFYCDCRDCLEKIYDALYDGSVVSNIFMGIVKHNKPRIYKHPTRPHNKWGVRIGHNQKFFSRFDEALYFVQTNTFVKDKTYE